MSRPSAVSALILIATMAAPSFAAEKPVKAAAAKPAVAAPAKAECRSTGWSVNAPGLKTIIQSETNGRWIVSAGMVSPGSTVVLHYTLSNHTRGEVALGSGRTEIVEGTEIAVELVGGSRPVASGSYRPECKKAK